MSASALQHDVGGERPYLSLDLEAVHEVSERMQVVFGRRDEYMSASAEQPLAVGHQTRAKP